MALGKNKTACSYLCCSSPKTACSNCDLYLHQIIRMFTHRVMRCIDADKQSVKSLFATLWVTRADMTKAVSIYHSPSVFCLLYR